MNANVTTTSQDDKNMDEIEAMLTDGRHFFTESDFHYNRTFADFTETATVPEQFKDVDGVTVRSFYLPNNMSLVRELIGKAGCYFIRYTEQSGAQFIWHNKARNTVEITGVPDAVMKATTLVQGRLRTLIRNKYRHLRFTPDAPSPLFQS